MARPGEKITRKTIMMQNKMKELDLKERSSKSLLANVLDMDDDFRPSSALPMPTAASVVGPAAGSTATAVSAAAVLPPLVPPGSATPTPGGFMRVTPGGGTCEWPKGVFSCGG